MGVKSLSLWVAWSLSLLAGSVSAKSAADYYVDSLPGQPDGPLLKMHAGHIEVIPEHHGNLFFWHFENRHLANRHRTVIWFNGGPGCSSMDGALMEVGPYRLKDDSTLVYNSGSWDEFANLLFIDNPVGTGFSYVDTDSYIHELPTMADNIITFLEHFFVLFPEFEENDIYLAGESYAGQHIPYIAKAIIERNKQRNMGKKWDLKGLLIGNGWISPAEQSEAYVDYAYKAGILERGSEAAARLESTRTACLADIKKDGDKQHVSYPTCEHILNDILEESTKDGKCVNMYDVRLTDTSPACGMNWPPDLKSVTPYLRKPDVIRALHVNPEKKAGWTECSGAVSGAFRARNSRPSIKILPEVLAEVPTVLFSGDKDLICNHLGTEQLINNMEWNGGKGFEISRGIIAPRRDWVFEGKPAGFYQEARNLTYVLFYNSSHMVPFDYPRRSRDMLDRMMKVDIGSIGGIPTDSRLDGEKGLETSVGGHPNSTLAEQNEQQKLDAARWSAYYRSGAIALIIVIILASAFTWYVWQDRRKRAGYSSLFGKNSAMREQGLQAGGMRRDVEAADFDENELEDLGRERTGVRHDERGLDDMDAERYSLGGMSSDDEDVGGGQGKKEARNGRL